MSRSRHKRPVLRSKIVRYIYNPKTDSWYTVPSGYREFGKALNKGESERILALAQQG